MRGWMLACCVLTGGCLRANPDWVGTSGQGGSADGSGTSDGTSGDSTAGETDGGPPSIPVDCNPLEPPTGEVVTVTPAGALALREMIDDAQANTTFVLEPGVYAIDESIEVEADGITVRSASGDPEDTTIDGGGNVESIFKVKASAFTVAEITLLRPREHGLQIEPEDRDVSGTRVYRTRFIDFGGQAITISLGANFADKGIVACSSFALTDEGRASLVECENVGGIRGQATSDWHIVDNRFAGLWCPDSPAKTAIFFAESSRDTLIERNVIHNCNLGIRLGLAESKTAIRTYPDTPCEGYFGHIGGLVRNNVVTATSAGIEGSSSGFDTGIAVWQVCGARVFHNTVVSTVPTFAGIDYRYPLTSVEISNNITTGPIMSRQSAVAKLAGNIEGATTEQFADADAGDVHLVDDAAAVDAGTILTDPGAPAVDFEGDPRDDGEPDVGADERTD